MWALVQRAKQDVQVVLTGQGTDEPWGGYRKYQQELIRSHAGEWFWKRVSHIPNLAMYPDAIKRGLRSIPKKNLIDRLVENYSLFSSEQRAALTGSASTGIAHERVRHWLAWQQTLDYHPTEQQMRIDTRMNLADDLLLYGDKISMAFGLEARVPMLDIELVQFVESLPLEYRRTIRKGKYLHKAMAEQYLPSEIVHRPKRGFSVPFGHWCRNKWKNRVEEILFSSGAVHLNHINRNEIQKIWDQHCAGAELEREISSLVAFAIWCENTLRV